MYNVRVRASDGSLSLLCGVKYVFTYGFGNGRTVLAQSPFRSKKTAHIYLKRTEIMSAATGAWVLLEQK